MSYKKKVIFFLFDSSRFRTVLVDLILSQNFWHSFWYFMGKIVCFFVGVSQISLSIMFKSSTDILMEYFFAHIWRRFDQLLAQRKKSKILGKNRDKFDI